MESAKWRVCLLGVLACWACFMEWSAWYASKNCVLENC